MSIAWVIGLWAGSIFVPTAVTQLAAAAGHDKVAQAQLSSVATFLLAVGMVLVTLAYAGCARWLRMERV